MSTLAMASLNRAGANGWPTQRDYADYAGITELQAIRHWELVREVFPGEDGPERVAKLMAADWGAALLERGETAVMSAPAAPFALA
jgi:hypothetical protein